MKIDVNHPTFISFLDYIIDNISSTISLENYFNLSPDKKLNTQYIVFKLLKSTVKVRATLTENEVRSFILILWKKNEEMENYEFASVLKDINSNFDAINEFTKPKIKSSKVKINDKC